MVVRSNSTGSSLAAQQTGGASPSRSTRSELAPGEGRLPREEMHEELRPFIPPILARYPQVARQSAHLAAAMFVDVAGFTKLSESLAAMGPEGAERLDQSIARYFDALTAIIEGYGGIPIKIGGDALTVLFPAGDAPVSHAARVAVACASVLRAAGREVARVETPLGPVDLGHKIGLGVGLVITGLVGNPSLQQELVFAGEALDQAAAAEHHSKAGQVCGSPELVELVPEVAWCPLVEGGFHLLDALAPPTWPAEQLLVIPGVPPGSPYLQHYRHLVPRAVQESAERHTVQYLCRHQTITVLFTSFSGMRFDRPETLLSLDRHYRAMQAIIHAHGGFLSEFEAGDKGAKFIILFGAPTSVEDPATQAVCCAWRMQQESRALGIVSDQRIGMTTGRLYVGRIGCRSLAKYSALGDRMNLAARLMAASGEWMVLSEHYTVQRTDRIAQWSPPHLLSVRGKTEPISVAHLEGLRNRRHLDRRGQGIVGRDPELMQLQGMVHALLEGQGGILHVTGPAGIGKSRLLEGLRRILSDAPPIHLLDLGDGFSQTTARPFEILRPLLLDLIGASGQLRGDALQEVFRAWHDGLPGDLRLPGARIAYMLDLEWGDDPILDRLPPDRRMNLRLQALSDIITGLCTDTPRVLMVDRADSLDPQSITALQTLLGDLSRVPLLFVLASRSSSGPREDVLAPLLAQPGALTLDLQPLSHADMTQLILHRLGATYLDSELENLLVERTQGNPLRAESWVEVLRTQKRVQVHEGMAYLRGGIEDLHLPDQLESLVLAQLERLTPDARLTLQIASVLGQSFTPAEVLRIHPMRIDGGTIKEHLSLSAHIGLVRYDRGNPPWMFFTREEVHRALHESLPFNLRRRMHASRAELLEEQYGENPPREVVLQLARHYAYIDHLELRAKYATRASQLCSEHYDHRGAVAWCRAALSALEGTNGSGERLILFELFQNSLGMLGENAERVDVLQRWIDEARLQNQLAPVVEALQCRARLKMRAGEYPAALEDLEQAESIARELGSTALLSSVLSALATTHVENGRIPEALSTVDRALELDLSPLMRAKLLFARGNAFSHLRNAQEAFRSYELAAPHLLNLDLTARALLEGNIGIQLFGMGRLEEGHEALIRSLEIKRKIGDRREEAVALNNVGYSSFILGDLATARQVMQEAARLARRLNSSSAYVNSLSNLGEFQVIQGELEDATATLALVEEALSHTRNPEQFSELCIRKGELCLAQKEARSAADLFQQALAEADAIHARELQINALEGLALTSLQLGEIEEARSRITQALELLDQAGGEVIFPQRVWWRASRVALAAGRHEEQARYEARAREVLHQKLAQFSTDATRDRFVRSFPWNREIRSDAGGN